MLPATTPHKHKHHPNHRLLLCRLASTSRTPVQISQTPAVIHNQAIPGGRKFVERLIDPVTWFTFFLLLVSFFQWRAMLRQSKHMEEGLNESRRSATNADEHMRAQLHAAEKSADATAEHAKLMRQQVVGTIGAVVRVYHNLSFGPVGMHIGFSNDGGVTATDLSGSVQLTRVMVPDLTTIGTPATYPVHFANIAPKSSGVLDLDFATDWLPMGKDSRADVWDAFVMNPKTVRVTVDFEYGNGFGDRVRGDRIDMTYMPAWEIQTEFRQSMPHHGAFRETEHLPDLFRSAKRLKDEEARAQEDKSGPALRPAPTRSHRPVRARGN